ncbi:MAG: SusC/RagA family TonB-linked outer membrane protein [Flavisolibacter sp.]
MKQIYLMMVFSWVLGCTASFAQQRPAVKGLVQSESGEVLPNVTVSVQNKSGDYSFSVQSNALGVFIFEKLNAGEIYSFTFSHVGYEKKVLSDYVYKGGDMITLSVKLSVNDEKMAQVVVVGYGTQRKVNLTGAVDQVGSEYFEDRPMPNVSRGLEGVIPNLNIKISDGKPTRSPSFNIRGVTSIGSGGSALVLIDGVPGDPATLNPNDIESVSVLKDASSAAIYGARGSFGVVLITTKSAKKDKIQVNYNTNYSINKRTFTPDLVNNGYEWAKNFDEAFYSWNDYLSHPQSINSQLDFSLAYLDSLKYHTDHPDLPKVGVDPSTGKYLYYSNTDWLKELYKDNNASLEHSLTVSGGTEKVNYLISGRYFHQDGIFRYNTDNFNRYNLRVKGSVKLTDWLTINSNSDFSSYKYKYPLTSVGGVNAIWRLMAVTAFPVSPMTNPDGSMSIVGAYSIGDFYYGKSFSTTGQNFLRNTIGFNAAILKNKLSIKGDFSYLYTNSNEDRRFFTVPYSIGPDKNITTGLNYLSNNVSNENYLVSNIYTEYSQSFGNHSLKLLGGWNYENDLIKNQFAQRDGLLVDNLTDFNLATGQNYKLSGGGNEWVNSGIFYRANYAFKNKYLLELDGRYDGSSKFPLSQAFGFFPSASAGWKITEEQFMNNTKNWLNNLKLRASYGALGNGNIAPYTFLQTIGTGTSSVIVNGGFPSYFVQPAVVPNGLTWETATTFDGGADIDVLKRRLKLTLDWYQRNTKGMITAGQPLPGTFGATVPKGNNADLITKGWEVSLDWSDKTDGQKPFSYSFRFTLADNVSRITKFYNPTNLLSSYYTGQELGDIWGFVTEGLFNSQDEITKHADQSYFVVSNANKLLPGDLKFADLNGDGKVNRGKNTLDDPGDQKIIGNSSIRFPYGFTGNLDWNQLLFSFFFQGIGKRDWFPSTEAAYFWGQYNRPYSLLPAFNLNRWTEANPSQDAYFPRYRGYVALSGTRELAVPQTRYLQNASYVRLKNLTIGYSLPLKAVQRLKLSSVRVYLTGQNLWTYSPMFKITKNFDPEVIEGSDPEINSGGGDGFSYPMQKTFTLGASINF